MEDILKISNIEKYYGNKSNLTKAVDNISFDVKEGEFVGIMGASGSGKTTLLNCIATIDKVTSGHIIINGKDITKNEILVSIISDMYFSKQSDFFEKEYNLGKVNSTIDMQYEGSESFSHVLISTTSTNIDEVEKDILDYVEKIKKEPIDEELFDTIKRKKIGELILSSDSLTSFLSNYYLVEQLAESDTKLINTIKEISGIPDDVYLLSPSVLESILKLKQKTSYKRNYSLNLPEVLIALSICSKTNPIIENIAINPLSVEATIFTALPTTSTI